MSQKCDFCENKLKTADLYEVKGVVIDKNPGIIKLTDVLLELYLCELDVSKICKECLDLISKQFNFKQKLRKKFKMPQSNVILQIAKFLNKNKESSQSKEFADILSIFPEHRKSLVERMHDLTPHIDVDMKVTKVESVSPAKVVQRKSVTFEPSTNFKNAMTSSSENDSSDSDYGKKSPKKRKKKSKSGGSKKQRLSDSFSVKEEEEPVAAKEQFEEPISEIKSEPEQLLDLIDDYDEPRKLVLNSSRLTESLNENQCEWLEDTIRQTEKRGKNKFVCNFCCKNLNSIFAMRYHYVKRHLLNKVTKEQIWIANKVKESVMVVKHEDGTKSTQWRCTECLKIYKNQPGIRYHMKSHVNSDLGTSNNISP